MAIDLHQFRMIIDSGAKGRALSAGYPDLLVRWEDIPGHEQMNATPRPDTKELQEHHSWPWPMYDTSHILQWLGLELNVIDISVQEGSEKVIDLNFPQDLGEFDLVIDPGTTEHCFNIAQAAVNLAASVKVGGFISQAIPMAMFNHGYYNLNPKWFLDFYGCNGFEVQRLVIRDKNRLAEPLERKARYMGIPDNAVLICLAKRVKRVAFSWPIDA